MHTKEIVMNTDKVIDLGKVSEETQGATGHFESMDPTKGIGA
jgi:hypothetical protein